MPGTKNKRLDWHPEAIAEQAESLAWYARRNTVSAKRMGKVIEESAHSPCHLMVLSRPATSKTRINKQYKREFQQSVKGSLRLNSYIAS